MLTKRVNESPKGRRVVSIAIKQREPLRFVLRVLSLHSMSDDASGKPTPSYKEILRSKDKDMSEANTL